MLMLLLLGMRLVVATGVGWVPVALVVVAPTEKRSLRTIFCDGLAKGEVESRWTAGACAATDCRAGAASLLLQVAILPTFGQVKLEGGKFFLRFETLHTLNAEM